MRYGGMLHTRGRRCSWEQRARAHRWSFAAAAALMRLHLRLRPQTSSHARSYTTTQQTCSQASFCDRNRGKASGATYAVTPGSVAVSGATLTAALANTAAPGAAFNLTLRAYAGGVVRVLVDEPGAGRYQVPDILLPELEARGAAWQAPSDGKGSWRGSVGKTAVVLSFSPFKLAVSVGGKEAAVVNSRSLFVFEHRRTKGVRSVLRLFQALARVVEEQWTFVASTPLLLAASTSLPSLPNPIHPRTAIATNPSSPPPLSPGL